MGAPEGEQHDDSRNTSMRHAIPSRRGVSQIFREANKSSEDAEEGRKKETQVSYMRYGTNPKTWTYCVNY